MSTLADIQTLLDKVKQKWGKRFYKHVDFCGLEPVINYKHYESTPEDSIIFAVTGGDGVHFSILTNVRGAQPIVMTVPMMNTNVVLAESLDEFLGLGYYNGWFSLEQLVYEFNETLEYYSTQDENLSIKSKAFLEFLRGEFKIQPVTLTEERLKELAKKYEIT